MVIDDSHDKRSSVLHNDHCYLYVKMHVLKYIWHDAVYILCINLHQFCTPHSVLDNDFLCTCRSLASDTPFGVSVNFYGSTNYCTMNYNTKYWNLHPSLY